MQVNGVPAAKPAVAAWTARLEEVAIQTQASFFEITTAIAFADFASRGVEIAVVEVGLGGRLDATNVIAPLAAGVTRIALEHTEYLGDDLHAIAREKAGIAKRGVPFLTTESDESLRNTMAHVAATAGAEFDVVAPILAEGYQLGLKGPHQVANASLAMALANVLPDAWRPAAAAVQEGLAAAHVPGRFDRRGGWIFDVAHNPDGARALAVALRVEQPARPLSVVLAVLKDKDWRGMMKALAPEVDEFVLTCSPSAPAERAWDLEEAVQWARSQSLKVRSVPTLAEALATAHAGAATVVVTGSFHTVGDAMTLLPGFSPIP